MGVADVPVVAPTKTPARSRHRPTAVKRLTGNIIAMAKAGLDELGVGSSSQDSMAVTAGRVQLPQWLFLYLIAQLIGGVWWAATLQSDVKYLQADNAKLWQKVETQSLQLSKIDEIVRQAVKDAVSDNFIRVKRKGE